MRYVLVGYESLTPDRTKTDEAIAMRVGHEFGDRARFWPVVDEWSVEGPVELIQAHNSELLFDKIAADGNAPPGYVPRDAR